MLETEAALRVWRTLTSQYTPSRVSLSRSPCDGPQCDVLHTQQRAPTFGSGGWPAYSILSLHVNHTDVILASSVFALEHFIDTCYAELLELSHTIHDRRADRHQRSVEAAHTCQWAAPHGAC